MDRWTGVVKVSLNPNNGGPFFKVAASLLLSPSSKTLTVPSVNAIFFNGDRVEGTGNPVIEKLSDPRNIAQLLVSKLGRSANAWVVEASTFKGPFAVYKEFIPSVNSWGDPKRYDPDGFPASFSIITTLFKSIEQVKSAISSSLKEPEAATMHYPAPSSPTAPPKTIILGFSKGGTVVNQIISELAHMNPESAGNLINSRKPSPELEHEIRDHICPISKDGLLFSISEFHYVDVGLNCAGAYLTDHTMIRKATENLLVNNNAIRFMLHGTPRQWCDKNRPWIRKEKDLLLQLLEEEAHRYEGKLQVLCSNWTLKQSNWIRGGKVMRPRTDEKKRTLADAANNFPYLNLDVPFSCRQQWQGPCLPSPTITCHRSKRDASGLTLSSSLFLPLSVNSQCVFYHEDDRLETY